MQADTAVRPGDAAAAQAAAAPPRPLLVRGRSCSWSAPPAWAPRSPRRGCWRPYFGASTIIWANTIATVLVALSAGYALGGRLADRRADLRGLCAVVLVAAVLLALVPFVADPFLRAVGQRAGLAVGGRRSSARWPRCWCWWPCR